MSKINSKNSVTIKDLQQKKLNHQKITASTCYDAAFAKIIDLSKIDCILVGDSLGNVMMGYENTIPVTVDDMIRYCASVARVITRPFLAVDMPFFTFRLSIENTLKNAARLVQEGGAHAVKLEGGRSVLEQVKAISAAGIPVIGHIGLTPQSIHSFGGYRVQGRGDEGEELFKDAVALEQAGASLLVLELVPKHLAGKISKTLKIPTIGIGAGQDCDGQILVLHDLLGMDKDFKPRFVKRYAQLSAVVEEALENYVQDVVDLKFPDDETSFEG